MPHFIVFRVFAKKERKDVLKVVYALEYFRTAKI